MLDKSALKINEKVVCRKIESFIKKQVKSFERDGAVLGISGGLDSAVTAYLCVRALGKENVLGLFLPERDSAPESFEDAKLVASSLGIKLEVKDMTRILEELDIYKLVKLPALIPFRRMKESIVKKGYEYYSRKTGENPFSKALLGVKKDEPYADILKKTSAYMRSKHRVREVIWYKYAEVDNLLVVGCCNKTEELTGWFVKYGDGAVDIAPLADLYKTQVTALATYLGVPERIITKTPTPDMLPGITDEFAIGIDYPTLDLILHGLEKGLSSKAIAKQLDVDKAKVDRVKTDIKRSAHMREMPFYPKIK